MFSSLRHGRPSRSRRYKSSIWQGFSDAKAKANAAQGLPDLLKIATNKVYEENRKDKHARDGKRYLYDIIKIKKKRATFSSLKTLLSNKTHFLLFSIM